MGHSTLKTPETVIRQIRKLRREGFSIRNIAAICGVASMTVQKYSKPPQVEHTEPVIPDDEPGDGQFDQ